MSFFLERDVCFVVKFSFYFEAHELSQEHTVLLYFKHAHYIFLSKTMDIKILCCKNTKTQLNVYINA